jgi:hypothetical protein
MAAETSVEPTKSNLAGVARVLVNAGKLSAKAAEELSKSARDRRSTFVSAEVEDAPVVKYIQKILLDAIQPAARRTSTSSPTRSSTGSATASTACC